MSTESEPHSRLTTDAQYGLAIAADSLVLSLASRKRHLQLSTSALGIAVNLEERERVVTAPLHVLLVTAAVCCWARELASQYGPVVARCLSGVPREAGKEKQRAEVGFIERGAAKWVRDESRVI